MDELYEAWEQVVSVVEELAENIRALFECFMEEEHERQKAESTPRKYGMSLIRQTRSSSVQYDYIPVMRRNLPYQRRRF